MLVLIIEDKPDNRELVKVSLSSLENEIVTTHDAAHGLELARERIPNLIVVDLRLPGGMDGWEMIKLMRAEPELQSASILVTAVEVLPEDRKRAIDAGCDAFLSKPFLVKELREIARNLLDDT